MEDQQNFTAWFQGYPNMLLGKINDDYYFNATNYLQSLTKVDHSKINIENFRKEEAEMIQIYADRLHKAPDEMFLKRVNFVFINSYLVFDFIEYAEKWRRMKTHDYLYSILTDGFVLSDYTLLSTVQKQIPPQVLKSLSQDLMDYEDGKLSGDAGTKPAATATVKKQKVKSDKK